MADNKMDELKSSITKGVTVLSVKANSFLETAKFKTHISSLKNDIKELKYQLGNEVYMMQPR